VTVSECGSHAVVAAAMGGTAGKGTGEQALARRLYPGLEEDWLLLADRNFFSWQDWCTAADTGAALLWRVRSPWIRLPVLRELPDGSYLSVLIHPAKKNDVTRRPALEAARRGEDLDPALARYVRVIGYEVPDRDGNGKNEQITLITTITAPAQAPARVLARAYHQRWLRHEVAWSEWNSRKEGRLMSVA
jgi:hypothetical protein